MASVGCRCCMVLGLGPVELVERFVDVLNPRDKILKPRPENLNLKPETLSPKP